MMEIERIMRKGVKVMMMDEKKEGIEKVIVKRIGDVMVEMKKSGMKVIMVEKNLSFEEKVEERLYIMDNGVVKEKLKKKEMKERMEEIKKEMGVWEDGNDFWNKFEGDYREIDGRNNKWIIIWNDENRNWNNIRDYENNKFRKWREIYDGWFSRIYNVEMDRNKIMEGDGNRENNSRDRRRDNRESGDVEDLKYR